MGKKSFRNFILTGALFGLFIIFTLVVSFVDSAPIGPLGSEVGLSSLNNSCLFKQNATWYNITEWLGLIPLLVAGAFVVYAIVIAIKHKGIKHIPSDIMLMGSIFCLLLGFYMFFEYVVINYRPVLIDLALEASYPSSHTLLSITVLGAGIIWLLRRNLNKPLKISLSVGASIIALVIVIGRLLSGYHWLTDIVGGVLLSLSLLMLYYSLLTLADEKLM